MTQKKPSRRFPRSFGRRETALLGVCLAVGAALSLLAWAPFTARLLAREELRLADQIHQLASHAPAARDVVVLGIDDASLTLEGLWPEDLEESEALRLMSGGWPWPRQVWAHLIYRLAAVGARAVVLDLALVSPSAPEADAALRDALERHPGLVVLGMDHEDRGRGGTDVELMLPAPTLLPGGARGGVAMGLLNFWPDPEDGVVRTQRPLWSRSLPEPRDWAPSLALAALRQQGFEPPGLAPDEDRLFRFCRADAFPPLALYEVLVESLWESNYDSGGFFKGKTVFVGASARHFQDEVETPVGMIFGVQAQAHAYSALRSGAWLSEAPVWFRQVMLWGAILAVWLLLAFIKRPLAVLGLLFAGAGMALTLQWLAHEHLSLVAPLLLPTAAWLVAGLFGLGYDFVLERRLRRDLLRYFSPDMAGELSQNPAPYLMSLGGVNRVITLLFSDLRGFTTLAESMPAQQLLEQLNQYLERMVGIVFATDGSIDKFIGDAVMAVWGRVREDQGEALLAADAVSGIEAALRMREAVAELNIDWAARGLPVLQVGIGLHQGEAVVGNIGSSVRMEFTAIGDTVNTAARLESLTKQYGVDLLVSESMRTAAGGAFVFRTADLVRVKGKTRPVAVFTVLDRAEGPPRSGLAEFELGLEAYRAGRFTEALELLERAANLGLDDPLTRLHMERCRALVANPPEGEWTGVFVAASK